MNRLEKYSFEKVVDNRLDTSRLSQNRKSFLNNLGFNEAQITKVEEPLLDKYLLHYCSNIEWYQQRQRKEVFNRRLYNVISIGLLIIIPIGVFLITNHFSKQDNTNAETVSAAMAAVLTSIFAVQKAFASWTEKRKLSSLFHSAGSKLKSRFYEIEENWHNASPILNDGEKIDFDMNFLRQLQEAIAFARQVVDEEQLAFYELVSFPKIELSNLLKSSGDEATSSLAMFQSKSFERRQEEAKVTATAKQRLFQWNADRQLRDAKRDILEQELKKLQKEYQLEKSPVKRKPIAESIINIERQIEDYLYENIERA